MAAGQPRRLGAVLTAGLCCLVRGCCALAAITTLAMLGGCGSPATDLGLTPAGPAPTVTVPFAMPVVITVAGLIGDQELALLDEAIARFEAGHPDILVNVAKLGDGPEQARSSLRARLVGGDAGLDLLILDEPLAAEFSRREWLRPLGDGLPASGASGRSSDYWVALPWAGTGSPSLGVSLSALSLQPTDAGRLLDFLASPER